MTIHYEPIGVIHSPFTEADGTPIQPAKARGAEGSVEVFPEFHEGLQDLDGFSHIILICHLHRSVGYSLRVVPFRDTVLRGVFATRAPRRPNPIGFSVVRLVGIRDGWLTIEDVDLLDGTPVLDIKPYFREFDERTETRSGWLGASRHRTDVADDRFE